MQDRLQKILDEYGLNSSRLADRLGVQRSGISHIMAGRNKPSFDFLTGLLKLFPEIDANWLLTGKGDMYRKDAEHLPPEDIVSETVKKDLFSKVTEDVNKSVIPETTVNSDSENNGYKSKQTSNTAQEIERIIILLKNGKFKSYNQE